MRSIYYPKPAAKLKLNYCTGTVFQSPSSLQKFRSVTGAGSPLWQLKSNFEYAWHSSPYCQLRFFASLKRKSVMAPSLNWKTASDLTCCLVCLLLLFLNLYFYLNFHYLFWRFHYVIPINASNNMEKTL